MNNIVKNVGLFTLGGGIGALITWKILQAYYEALVEDELESIRLLAKKQSEKKDSATYVENEYENVKKMYNINEQRAEDVDPDTEEEETEFPDDYELAPEFGTYPVPYPISEEEYSTEKLEYDKLSLMYYTDDEVLTDDQGVPVDDILQLVGQETADYLIAVSGNRLAKYDSTVYVRNESITSDFEITIFENSYPNAVLGYDGSAVKPKTTPKTEKPRKPRKKGENGDNE